MEKFLLNFTNTFRSKMYAPYAECIETRCGVFQFDNFRPLPFTIVEQLHLVVLEDYDAERDQYLFRIINHNLITKHANDL